MSRLNPIKILEEHNLKPVLLDLGASGGTYQPFEAIKRQSRLIEVDPDDRDFSGNASKGVDRIVVREAIISDKEQNLVDIHLTADPHCSSTLLPDVHKLKNYTYASLFEVQKSVSVPATSLDRLSLKLGFHFDWMKIDTQGSELEILKSMQGPLLDQLLCCDAEISLYPHYIDAGAFSQFHDFMTKSGFQIANLVRVQSRLRMRPEDLNAFTKNGGHVAALKRWPTSLELRYIRSISHDSSLPPLPVFLKLWVIAYVTGNQAYCHFLACRLEQDYPEQQRLAQQLQLANIQSAGYLRGLGRRVQQKLATAMERLLERNA